MSFLVAGSHARFAPPSSFLTTLAVYPSPDFTASFSHSRPWGCFVLRRYPSSAATPFDPKDARRRVSSCFPVSLMPPITEVTGHTTCTRRAAWRGMVRHLESAAGPGPVPREFHPDVTDVSLELVAALRPLSVSFDPGISRHSQGASIGDEDSVDRKSVV